MEFPKFLRVTVATEKEIANINGTATERFVYKNIDVKFAQVLSKELGFSYELVTPGDKEVGGVFRNGSWTAAMGMIERNETDLVVSVLAASEQRRQIADFSDTYFRVGIGFATAKPTYTPDLKVFLSPFSWEVWLLALLCLLLMPAIFYLIFRNRYSVHKLALVVYSTFVRQSVDVEPRKKGEYLLMIFWKLAVGFLGYGYTAVLLSFLSFPPLTGIRTIPELAKAVAKGECQCVTFPGAYTSAVLTRTSDITMNVVGRNLLGNRGSMDVAGTLKEATKSRKIAFVSGKQFLLPHQMRFFVSEDEFFPSWRALGLQKGFCCKERLNQAISRVWSYGFYYKIVGDDIFLESLKVNLHFVDEENKEKPLSMEDFGGAFAVLMMGYVLSTIVFILEVIVSKTQAFEKLCKQKI